MVLRVGRLAEALGEAGELEVGSAAFLEREARFEEVLRLAPQLRLAAQAPERRKQLRVAVSRRQPALGAADDVILNTVMSYTSVAGHTGASGLTFYPTTLMPDDIAAIQYIYGANTTYHSGDDNYVFNEGQDYLQTIWDAGGNDTVIVESFTGR